MVFVQVEDTVIVRYDCQSIPVIRREAEVCPNFAEKFGCTNRSSTRLDYREASWVVTMTMKSVPRRKVSGEGERQPIPFCDRQNCDILGSGISEAIAICPRCCSSGRGNGCHLRRKAGKEPFHPHASREDDDEGARMAHLVSHPCRSLSKAASKNLSLQAGKRTGQACGRASPTEIADWLHMADWVYSGRDPLPHAFFNRIMTTVHGLPSMLTNS